ncbi:MAG: FMN-dependent NADH-azoreductase [Gammaproteobacteria bacterium]
MKTLLQLNTSLFSSGGQSSRLADQFVAIWRDRNPEAKVITRDLAADPVPHLTAEGFQAFLATPAQRTGDQRAIVAYSDALIGELKAADVIVLGLPMYNFGVPSTLKAYFDHVARAGVTFRYTEKGPAGLLTGKRAYVFAARGGSYAGTPLDTQTAYVRDFLRFLGIAEVEFIYAEGLAVSEASKAAALVHAKTAIERLAEERVGVAA